MHQLREEGSKKRLEPETQATPRSRYSPVSLWKSISGCPRISWSEVHLLLQTVRSRGEGWAPKAS